MAPRKRQKLQKRSKAVEQRVAVAKRKRQDAGGDARSAFLKKEGSKTRKDKIHDIEQSIGSIDRRINTALEKGDTSLAKDLRSRQNKFTTKLGYERAIKGGGVSLDKSGRIIRTGSGDPILTTRGSEIFDETKDMDFIDPTRRIQNVAGDAYGKMYPISSFMQKGPLVLQGLKSLFKTKKRDIPYTDPMMPGERYPLDEIIKKETITEEEPFYGGRSLLDEDSSLDDIIKRYTPPEPERKVPTDPDLEEQWPPSPFEPIDPNQEVVDEFGLSTTVPKEAIVKDVLKNLTENIMMEENVSQDEALNIARNSLAETTLTKPSFNLGEFTEKFRTNNAEKEAKTILASLPPEIIQKIPPEVITSSSAIDIINSLPPEIVEKTKVEIQTKAIPNIYQAPGEKVLTMADLAAEAGTSPTLKQAFPLKKMATTVADMIPYLATGFTGNQIKDFGVKALNKYGDMKEKIFGKAVSPINTGWTTQSGDEWWKEQEAIKDNTADLLKNQYDVSDEDIAELLNIKTGLNF